MALSAIRFFRSPVYLRYMFYSTESAATVTHTGQTFSHNDPSVARFTISDKLVNKQFAEKLIAEVPPIACKENVISCDGGSGALGHPKVYINLKTFT
ncbi:unnamed protein product [Schistosoma turkestanicum]|nr:unnamed protein product [Schistosoma turkestanicum]